MSVELLTILKFCLLALIYLFFFRVLRAVWAEITPPKVPGAARGRNASQGPPIVMIPPGAPVAAAPQAPTVAVAAVAPPRPPAPPQRPTGAPPAGPGPGPAPGPGPGPEGQRGRRPGGPGQLVVVEPPPIRGRVFSLDPQTTMGRAAHCAITLDDTFVSQEHARLHERDGSYVVEDLGSTNGTYLNRNRLTGAMIMQRGDRLQVGNTVLELV